MDLNGIIDLNNTPVHFYVERGIELYNRIFSLL